MKLRGWDTLGLSAIVVAAGMSLMSFDRLPARVATHFNHHGQPNGWMSRELVAFGMPAFIAAIWTWLRFSRLWLPRLNEGRISIGHVAMLSSLTATFVMIVHGFILYSALEPGTNLLRASYALVGVLWIILGLVMPRVRRNPAVAIKTVWSFVSDEHWARTYRMGGYSMVLGGLASLLVVALFPGSRVGGLVFAILITSAFAPVVYAMLLARYSEGRRR